jgi:hypothetical protein
MIANQLDDELERYIVPSRGLWPRLVRPKRRHRVLGIECPQPAMQRRSAYAISPRSVGDRGAIAHALTEPVALMVRHFGS